MKLGVAFDVHFGQRVVDGQQIVLKINRSPSQSQDLTSSQTVHRRNENDKSHAVVLCCVKELLQLVGGKRLALKGHDLRRIDLLHGIVHDQIHSVSVLEHFVQKHIFILDRVCTDAFQLMDAKVLDVACLDLVQLQLFDFKIRQNLLHRHIPVGAVGRGFYRLFDS